MYKKISRLDYFTLQVFVGLVELRNGIAVAEKLLTTQSKVSRSLMCLREVLENELFIRQQYGFEPNHIALRLYPMVQTILEQYDKIIAITIGKTLEPFQLTIATYEQWSLMVMNNLKHTCHCIEGGVNINVMPWSENISQRLCQGKVDCTISTEPIHHPMVNNIKLGDIDHFFMVARSGHPILSSTQPLVDLFNYNITLVNTNLHEQQLHGIEQYAQAHNIDLNIVLRSPSLRMLVDHTSRSDDICLLSSVMSLPYFEHRSDVGFIDVSEQWLATSGLPCDSYYLHCHQGVIEPLANCLKTMLTDKLHDMQARYHGKTPSLNYTKLKPVCGEGCGCNSDPRDATGGSNGKPL